MSSIVVKHIAEYGMPKDKGGKGNIYKIAEYDFFIVPPSLAVLGPNWWKIGGCDAVGAFVGTVGGPVGIAGGAVACSACAIIGFW